MFNSADDMLAFSKLLSTPEDNEDRSPTTSTAMVTPGSFGAPREDPKAKAAAAAEAAKKKKKDPKDIWDDSEVPPEDAILVEDLRDGRPRPR